MARFCQQEAAWQPASRAGKQLFWCWIKVMFFTVSCLSEATPCVYVRLMLTHDTGAAVAPSQQGMEADSEVLGGQCITCIYALSQLVLAALDSGATEAPGPRWEWFYH